MARNTPTACAVFATVAALFLTAGCEEEKKARKDDSTADAGPNQAMRDKRIDKALQAAQASSAAASTAQDGPPENGVFEPGKADQALPPGAAPKIEVFSDGSAPRVDLTPKLAGNTFSVRVMVGKRTGQRAFPNIVYTLVGKIAGDEAEAEAAAKPLSKATPVVLTVANAELDPDQPGRLPEGLAKDVARLKGSSLQATLDPRGALQDVKLTLGKDAVEEMKGVLDALVEASGIVMWPVPNKPVGAGAYWMTTDRTVYQGMTMLRYRVTKVTEVKGDEVVLSQDLRQYVVSATEKMEGAPAELALAGLNSQGKGAWTRKAGALVASSGEAKLPAMAQLAAGQPGQVLPIQVEVNVRVIQRLAVDGKGAKGKK